MQNVVSAVMASTAKLVACRSGALLKIGRGCSLPINAPSVRHVSPAKLCLQGRQNVKPNLYTTKALSAPTREDVLTSDPNNNISDLIFEKIGVNLHKQPGHPLCTIKSAIEAFFQNVS